MTPEERAAMFVLLECAARTQDIGRACKGAGIEYDETTRGAFLLMAAKLVHQDGESRGDWLAACAWLWDRLTEANPR